MLKTAIALVIMTAYTGCADSAEDFLINRGRPGPINCISQGEESKICSDGAGVTWMCEKRVIGADNQCVVLTTVPLTPEHR